MSREVAVLGISLYVLGFGLGYDNFRVHIIQGQAAHADGHPIVLQTSSLRPVERGEFTAISPMQPGQLKRNHALDVWKGKSINQTLSQHPFLSFVRPDFRNRFLCIPSRLTRSYTSGVLLQRI